MDIFNESDWLIKNFVDDSILSESSFVTENINIGTFFDIVKHTCTNKTTDLKKLGFVEQKPEKVKKITRTKKIYLEPTKEQKIIINNMFRDYYFCYNAGVRELYIYLIKKKQEHNDEIREIIKKGKKLISDNKKLSNEDKKTLKDSQKRIKFLVNTEEIIPKYYLEGKLEKELQGKTKWLFAHTIRRALRQVQSAYKTMMTLKRNKINTKSGKYMLSLRDLDKLKVKTLTLPPIYI